MKGKKMGDGSGKPVADASRPRKLVPGLGYQFRLNSDGWLKLSDGRAWVAFPPEAAVALRDFLAEGAGTMIRLLILSLLLTGCSGEPYGGAVAGLLVTVSFALLAVGAFCAAQGMRRAPYGEDGGAPEMPYPLPVKKPENVVTPDRFDQEEADKLADEIKVMDLIYEACDEWDANHGVA